MIFHTLFILDGKNMYSRISRKLTSWLINLDVIEGKIFEVYEYGFELIFSLIFSTSIIIAISFLMNKFFETILYLIGFFGVRAICGGYHAKHQYSCFAITMSTYFLFLFLSCCPFIIFHLNPIMFFTIIASIFIILAFSPIEHPDNPMTEYRKKRCRFLSIILSLILCIILGVSILKNTTLSVFFSYITGTFFASFAILVAKIELIIFERKEKK